MQKGLLLLVAILVGISSAHSLDDLEYSLDKNPSLLLDNDNVAFGPAHATATATDDDDGEVYSDDDDSDLLRDASHVADELLDMSEGHIGVTPEIPLQTRESPVIAGEMSSFGDGGIPEVASEAAKTLNCEVPDPGSGLVAKAVTMVKNLVGGCGSGLDQKKPADKPEDQPEDQPEKADEDDKEQSDNNQNEEEPESEEEEKEEGETEEEKAEKQHDAEEEAGEQQEMAEEQAAQQAEDKLDDNPLVKSARTAAEGEVDASKEEKEAFAYAQGKEDENPVDSDGSFKIQPSSNPWRQAEADGSDNENTVTPEDDVDATENIEDLRASRRERERARLAAARKYVALQVSLGQALNDATGGIPASFRLHSMDEMGVAGQRQFGLLPKESLLEDADNNEAFQDAENDDSDDEQYSAADADVEDDENENEDEDEQQTEEDDSDMDY